MPDLKPLELTDLTIPIHMTRAITGGDCSMLVNAQCWKAQWFNIGGDLFCGSSLVEI